MIDKSNNQDFNKDFLDDSWRKMETLLNEELPIGTDIPLKGNSFNPKARSLVVLLLLISTSLGYLLFTPGKLSDDSFAAKANETHTEDHIGFAQAMAKTETNLHISPPSIPQEDDQNDFANLPLSIKQSTQTISRVGTTLPDSYRGKLPEHKQNINTPTETTTTSSHPPYEKKTTSLHLKSNHNISILQGAISTHSSMQVIRAASAKWKLGLMAGLQQERRPQGFGGYYIAMLLSRRLMPKYSIDMGLALAFHKYNNTLLNNSPLLLTLNQGSSNSMPGIEETITAEPYSPTDSERPPPIRLDNATWLSLPVALAYQPVKKLRINMGLEYALLLRARAAQSYTYPFNRKEKINHLISRNNVSAICGITWFPQKNVAFDLRYIFGFSDLSKPNPPFVEQTHTRTALQGALIYYFEY
ncbi:MAG TPA: hypothetical protein ENJ45_03275 [Phaeodactylibacter sp.]|nr:hypothetical protein [Phaeodactylibacter sp.]